jgi:hypothetical protein
MCSQSGYPEKLTMSCGELENLLRSARVLMDRYLIRCGRIDQRFARMGD